MLWALPPPTLAEHLFGTYNTFRFFYITWVDPDTSKAVACAGSRAVVGTHSGCTGESVLLHACMLNLVQAHLAAGMHAVSMDHHSAACHVTMQIDLLSELKQTLLLPWSRAASGWLRLAGHPRSAWAVLRMLSWTLMVSKRMCFAAIAFAMSAI